MKLRRYDKYILFVVGFGLLCNILLIIWRKSIQEELEYIRLQYHLINTVVIDAGLIEQLKIMTQYFSKISTSVLFCGIGTFFMLIFSILPFRIEAHFSTEPCREWPFATAVILALLSCYNSVQIFVLQNDFNIIFENFKEMVNTL